MSRARFGGVLNDLHLSRGYAVASSSLNVFGNNCNGVLSAETMMMVKERFIETVRRAEAHDWLGRIGRRHGAVRDRAELSGPPGRHHPVGDFPDATTYFIESEDCRMCFART